MNIKTNLRFADSKLATVKLNNQGILLIEFKRVMPTRNNLMHLNNAFTQVIDPNEKYPTVILVNKVLPFMRDSRVLFEVHLEAVSKSIAWVYSSELGKMISRIFVDLSLIQTPMYYTNTFEDAEEWSGIQGNNKDHDAVPVLQSIHPKTR